MGSQAQPRFTTQACNARHRRSPSPPPAAGAVCYRHDPYKVLNPYATVKAEGPEAEALFGLCLPDNYHVSLFGHVEFVQFPVLAPVPPSPCHYRKPEMSRLFFGQLPYKVTDEQLQWICEMFGESRVDFPERITRDFNGRRQLTGCIHAYCEHECVQYVVRGLNKRVLVDNTGVWYARTHEQYEKLQAYCNIMKANREARPDGMPYDTVVVEAARSTYVPPQNWSEDSLDEFVAANEGAY